MKKPARVEGEVRLVFALYMSEQTMISARKSVGVCDEDNCGDAAEYKMRVREGAVARRMTRSGSTYGT